MTNAQEFASAHDWLTTGPCAPHVVEHRLVGPTPIGAYRLLQPPGHFPDPPLPEFSLFTNKAPLRRLKWDIDGNRWAGPMKARVHLLVPPGCATSFEADDPQAFTILTLPSKIITAVFEDLSFNVSRLEQLCSAPWLHDLIAALESQLWRVTSVGGAIDALLVDQAVMLLATCLASACEPQTARAQPRASGGLSPRMLSRVEDFVEANISRTIGMIELANLTGLSPSHFNRAFRTSTGQSPARFVLQRRLDHAARLLVARDVTVEDVAKACGFKGGTQFGRAFARQMGATPRRYRHAAQGRPS